MHAWHGCLQELHCTLRLRQAAALLPSTAPFHASLACACSKGVVRAGHQQKELPAVKASHGGSASWDQPAELALGADATQGQSAAGGCRREGVGSRVQGACWRATGACRDARCGVHCWHLPICVLLLLLQPLSMQAVTVELSSSGLMGGSLGRVRVPVRDILQRRKFSQGYPLEGGSAWGQVHLEIEWKPYF